MSAHTPGPWVIGWGNGLTGPTTAAVRGPTVAGADYDYEVVSVHTATIAIVPKQDSGVMEANARLIAAAPELLEALTAATVMLEAIEAHCVNERGLKGIDHAEDGRRGRAAMQALIPDLRAALAKVQP